MKMTSTKFAQDNLNHTKAASAVIARAMVRNDTDFVLVQEPWVYRGRIKGLTQKNTQVICDTRKNKTIACVILKTYIMHLFLTEFLSADLVAIQMMLDMNSHKQDVILAAGYFPCDDAHAPPELVEKRVKHCETNKLPLTLRCDSNAHNEVWGCTGTNQKSEYLLHTNF